MMFWVAQKRTDTQPFEQAPCIILQMFTVYYIHMYSVNSSQHSQLEMSTQIRTCTYINLYTHSHNLLEVTTSSKYNKYHRFHPGSSTWVVESVYTVYVQYIHIYIYICKYVYIYNIPLIFYVKKPHALKKNQCILFINEKTTFHSCEKNVDAVFLFQKPASGSISSRILAPSAIKNSPPPSEACLKHTNAP